MLEEMKAQGMEIIDDVDIQAFQKCFKRFLLKKSRKYW